MDLTAIIITFIVIGLPVMALTLIKLAKIITGETRTWRNRASGSDEAQLMQEIHRNLASLEKRIDSLETIVLDRYRK